MTISISGEICKKYDLTFKEVLAILLVKESDDISKLFNDLENKGVLINDTSFGGYLIANSYDARVSNILLDSDKERQPEARIDKLAEEMILKFPRGKKEGTTQYFRGNKKDIILRLKKFFKLYGNSYTDEQILNATEAYVNSFNGNYSYMRVLKYFIWKDERKVDSEGRGYISESSDLATYIENVKDNNIDRDWASTLK